jgi:hypothetical protein
MEDQERAAESRDEEICLSSITNHLYRVSNGETYAISEIIARSVGKDGPVITQLDADMVLRRIGIRVKDGFVFFANGHPEINKMLEKTSYSSNYNSILKRIDGSRASEKVRFLAGEKPVRACGVPLSYIFEESGE